MIRRICPTCGRARYITLPSEGGNELLPCPFCGGEVRLTDLSATTSVMDRELWSIGCRTCHYSMSTTDGDQAELVGRWNRRV